MVRPLDQLLELLKLVVSLDRSCGEHGRKPAVGRSVLLGGRLVGFYTRGRAEV